MWIKHFLLILEIYLIAVLRFPMLSIWGLVTSDELAV